MDTIRTDNWAKGANNIAKPERLPAGFVRELVNLDPTGGGQLEMRASHARVLAADDMRLSVSLTGRVVYVDGGDIGVFLLQLAQRLPMAAAEHHRWKV